LSSAFSFVFAFVLMLSVLIFVHELGHFVAAKLCKVKVLKFSLGFGNPIGFGRYRLRWKHGDTEYVAAWVPLGGFVKMLGENADEQQSAEVLADSERAFHHRPVWQRLVILFAGPAMNLLLPIVLFAVALAIGTPREAAIVGSVEADSPAALAGLRPGDQIEAVAGQPVEFWDDVARAVRRNAGQSVALRARRGTGTAAQQIDMTLKVEERGAIDPFGQATRAGWVGFSHNRLAAVLAIAGSEVPAAATALRSGDRVLAVDSTQIEDWDGFASGYAEAAAAGSETVELRVARLTQLDPVPSQTELTLRVPLESSVEALGLVPATVLIRRVSKGTPAEAAGLRAGDLIIAVAGRPVGSFPSFANAVRSSEGRALQIAYARAGERLESEIAPKLVEADAGMGLKEERYQIGIEAEPALVAGAVAIHRVRNPIRSIPIATQKTWEITKTFVQGLKQLVTGRVSHKQLAGPIGIAQIAHQAFQLGWYTYLQTLILISINLGILNLLPIPILDGGQAVLVGIEGIKRSPISQRTREAALQVGVAMIVVLMGFAFWNDISRLVSNWLSG
jgi:regulator of sigma E protease